MSSGELATMPDDMFEDIAKIVVPIVGLLTAWITYKTARANSERTRRERGESDGHDRPPNRALPEQAWRSTTAPAAKPRRPLPTARTGSTWWTESSAASVNHWAADADAEADAPDLPIPDPVSTPEHHAASHEAWWNRSIVRESLLADPVPDPDTAQADLGT